MWGYKTRARDFGENLKMELAWYRKNKTPRSNSEHDEQVTLFARLKLNEQRHPAIAWIHAIANGGHRHPAVAGKMKAEGVKKGISDIFVPFPTREASGLYIEMKAGKNKLTPEQKEFGEYAESVGYKFITCWTCDEAAKAIEDYLGIELR